MTGARAAWAWCAAIGLGMAQTADAASPTRVRVRPVVRTHTAAAFVDLSGPGSAVGGLPATYDTTFFEWGWGGKQALFNGSGVTTNTTYPLVDGEAIVTADQYGVSAEWAGGLSAGVLGLFYAAGGQRGVGRTFGPALPSDQFERDDGRLTQERVTTEFHQAWIEDREGPLTYQVIGGSLKDLDLNRTEHNYLKLGSLLFRPPINNASFFEKDEHKLLTGRHPIRGAEAVVTVPYAEDRELHADLFVARTTPTPVAETDRDAVGGRWSADLAEGNLGLSFIATEGERNPSITGERQVLWALDGSYDVTEWFACYGAWAHTQYHRSGRLNGQAWVGGVRLVGPRKSEWRAQYQAVGEDYDLMGHHKPEHYPSNLHGVHTSAQVPITQAATLKTTAYRLRQLETNTHDGDRIFGDSYFPAIADSARGDITVARAEASYDFGRARPGLPKLLGYAEWSLFQKEAPDTANNDIDKQVTNWYVNLAQPLVKGLSVELGYRLASATGRWQAMRFHHRQGVPEFVLSYRRQERGQDRLRVTAMYQHYDFVDSIGASQGRNNYAGHQMLVEAFWAF